MDLNSVNTAQRSPKEDQNPFPEEAVSHDPTQATRGKMPYVLVPVAGSDYKETAAWIKGTVGADDLMPWTDVGGNLRSWTVECNNEELAKLKKHPAIKSVKPLEIPEPRVKVKTAGFKAASNKYTGTKPPATKTRAPGIKAAMGGPEAPTYGTGENTLAPDFPAATDTVATQTSCATTKPKAKPTMEPTAEPVIETFTEPAIKPTAEPTTKTSSDCTTAKYYGTAKQPEAVATAAPKMKVTEYYNKRDGVSDDEGAISPDNIIRSLDDDKEPTEERDSPDRLTERQEETAVIPWILFPKDPVNQAQNQQTEQFLKTLTGEEPLQHLHNDALEFWTIDMNKQQSDQAGKNPGVGSIEPDIIFEYNRAPPPAAPSSPALANREKGTAVTSWVLYATNPTNETLNRQTEQFLTKLTGNAPFRYLDENDILKCWAIDMNKQQSEQAAKDPGVRSVEPNIEMEFSRAYPPAAPPLPSASATLANAVVKREIKYQTQKKAVSELVSLSQPSSIPNLNDLENYVFESNNGAKSFVYHIERGVSFIKQAAEFPKTADGHIRSSAATKKRLNPEDDSDQLSHGTCTAGKAVGQRFGAAKQATLVVAKIDQLVGSEISDALDLIAKEVRSLSSRQRRSVVTISMGGRIKFDPNSPAQRTLKAKIQDLINLDVPVVVASGNHATGPNPSPEVDSIPAFFADENFPLIVVGSTKVDGTKSDFSQGGPKVTTHAIGEDVTCMPRDGSTPLANNKGTSFAAPLVAGEIANLLSYDTLPFNAAPGSLVKNLRDYLRANDKAGWDRKAGTRMIYNGVPEANNPRKAGTETQPAPTIPSCAGLVQGPENPAVPKYVAREALRNVIEGEKGFCQAAANQGGLDPNSASIVRRYYAGTIEEVDLAMDFQPGLDFKPNYDDCVKVMLSSITDGCDGNDPDGNPENYKGGGSMKVGEVTYRIVPKAIRQPAKDGLKGGCDSTYKFFWNEYTMWGHGFASDDSGEELKGQVDDCALLPDTWSFQYGLGSDGREWTAKFRTGVFQRGCVGQAGKEAGAPVDFGCAGSG